MITRTATIAGGSFASLLETPEALDATHLQYFDAADQIERRRYGRQIAAFALAHGQTIVSLAQSQNCKPLAGYARRTGNSDAAAGLCGSLQVGEVAAQFTANQTQFHQFLVKGRSEVIIRQGGNVDAIEDNCFMGSGGGVGGGAGRTIHQQKVRDYLHAGLAVRSHHVRLGPSSHVGVRTDNAIQQNAAATVCTDIYLLLHERLLSPHETRELTLVECPPCGNDEALRDYYTRTLAQAIACPAVRDAVTAQSVNGSNNLKAVSIVQPAWYERIPASDIEKTAFAAYSPLIRRLRSNPVEVRPITLLPISIVPRKRDVVSESDFVALATSKVAKLANLVGIAVQSPHRYRAKLQVRVESGKVDLRKLDAFFNSFDASFQDFVARRDFIYGLLPEIEHQYRHWQRRKVAILRSLKLEIARLVFRLTWSFARGIWLSRVVSAAQLSRRKICRLRKVFQAIRAKASELRRCVTVLRVLGNARKRLLAERKRIHQLLYNMDTALDSFEPFRPLRHAPVEMEPLAEAWPVLSEMQPGHDSANRLALIRLARKVTGHGLQKILNARDYDAASLAQAILTARPTEGPHWGNDGATRHYHTSYHVLPPLAGSLQNQIEECLFGTGVLVKFTNTCVGGVTAVRLRFSTPHDTAQGGLREIFTPQLRAAFKATLSKSRREEHYPQGDAAWQWLATHLGIRLPARRARINEEPLIASGATNHK